MLPPQQRRQSSLPLENVASARLMDLVRDRMPREYHDTAVPVEGRSRGWDDEDARRDGKRTKTMDPKEEEDEDEETEHEQVEEDQGDEYMETPPPAPRSKRIPKPRALTPTPGPTPTRKLTKIKPPLKPRVSKAKGKGVATGSKGKVFIGELGSKEEEREQEGAAAGPSTAEGAEFVPEGEEADAGLGEVVEDWSRARKDNHVRRPPPSSDLLTSPTERSRASSSRDDQQRNQPTQEASPQLRQSKRLYPLLRRHLHFYPQSC